MTGTLTGATTAVSDSLLDKMGGGDGMEGAMTDGLGSGVLWTLMAGETRIGGAGGGGDGGKVRGTTTGLSGSFNLLSLS